MKSTKLNIVAFVCLSIISCKKYLEPGPPATQLISSTVFANDATAIAAQLSIYAQMEATGLQHQIMLSSSLASDEAINHSSSADAVTIAANNIVPTNGMVNNLWANLYKYIYYANAVLNGLDRSVNVSEGVKRQLRGEALFVRSFCHFYLCNLYGAVPYVTSTDYHVNAKAVREDVSIVLTNISSDLAEAKDLLAVGYLSAVNATSNDRVRPNRFAAAALLARIYLWQRQWAKAESEANFVIQNTATYSLSNTVSGVFLKNSKEAILQWMATLPRYNSYTGGTLVASSNPTSITLRPALLSTFEANDLRKANWVKSVTSGSNTYHFPYKYQVGQNAAAVTEYTTVLRLAELYLIRAEARVHLGDFQRATSDIDVIRVRAGLSGTAAITSDDLLAAIRQERRFELFAEFGDRWLDLKRTGLADVIMPSVKSNNWATTDALFPIPQIEIDRNPLLIQNPGY